MRVRWNADIVYYLKFIQSFQTTRFFNNVCMYKVQAATLNVRLMVILPTMVYNLLHVLRKQHGSMGMSTSQPSALRPDEPNQPDQPNRPDQTSHTVLYSDLPKLDDQHYTYRDQYQLDWRASNAMWQTTAQQVAAHYYCLSDRPGVCVVRLDSTLHANIAEIMCVPAQSTMLVVKMLRCYAGTNVVLLAMSAAWQVMTLVGRNQFVWLESYELLSKVAGQVELFDKPDWPRQMSRLPPKGVKTDDLERLLSRHNVLDVTVRPGKL